MTCITSAVLDCNASGGSTGLQRAGPTAALHTHARHPQRLHPGRSSHRQDPRHPARTGTPPRPAGAGGDRQGLLGPHLPRLPAQTRHQGHHPRTHRLTRRPTQRPRTALRLDRTAYRRRNVVERCFHRLKQWRDIAIRYDKQPDRYLAAITLASTSIWLQTCPTRRCPGAEGVVHGIRCTAQEAGAVASGGLLLRLHALRSLHRVTA
ncbi:hypothetical protein E4U92_18550 [Streptomyces galbus]|uniref:Uncharacterized protein n=1 Tax=Streptomyces galbus TaxID=33898 RepID=A0A4U5WZE6_STRGB|nr:hypothetical protein E4U92_18550 [Streptomyces galbus]